MSVDSNVLIALWDQSDALNSDAQLALDSALRRGDLVLAAPVFAELMAAPQRDEGFIDSFLQDTGRFRRLEPRPIRLALGGQGVSNLCRRP